MTADQLDIAAEITELHTQAALKAHKEAQQTNKESAFYCVECDDLIPHQRRQAIKGVQLCVACQQAKELKQKQGAL